MSVFVLLRRVKTPDESCSHGQKLSILRRRAAIFARTVGSRKNIELALWICYQEKETEVPVEPAGVRTVFYCGVIEPTERRRKWSQIVDGTGSSRGTSHDATVECLGVVFYQVDNPAP